MLAVCRQRLAAENTADSADGFAPRPGLRPLTKLEQRGLRLGHGVWDVVFPPQVASEANHEVTEGTRRPFLRMPA